MLALAAKGDKKSKNELCAIAKDRGVPPQVAKKAVDQLSMLHCTFRILEVARTARPELGTYALSKIDGQANVSLPSLKRAILTSSLMAIALNGTVTVTNVAAVNALKMLGDWEKLEFIKKKTTDESVRIAAERALKNH